MISRLRSSLLFKNKRLANLLRVFPWRATAKLWAAVVFPEPGGPRKSICERASGLANMVFRMCGNCFSDKIMDVIARPSSFKFKWAVVETV